MTSIFDVAAYVLDKLGVMTTMKLEKLCYYSQAWSLVWDERRLFPERFEAWANGPVCPDLYHAHKGMFKITRGDIHGDPSNIDEDGTSTIASTGRISGIVMRQNERHSVLPSMAAAS